MNVLIYIIPETESLFQWSYFYSQDFVLSFQSIPFVLWYDSHYFESLQSTLVYIRWIRFYKMLLIKVDSLNALYLTIFLNILRDHKISRWKRDFSESLEIFKKLWEIFNLLDGIVIFRSTGRPSPMIYLNTSEVMKNHQVSCLTFWSFLNIVDEKRKSQKRRILPFLQETLLKNILQRHVLPGEVTLHWQQRFGCWNPGHKIVSISSCQVVDVENLLEICMRKCFSCCFFMHLFSIFASHYSNLFISQLTRLFSNVIIFE